MRLAHPTTAHLWQTLNNGKAPGIPNNQIISGPVHGQITTHCLGVVCQTLPVVRYPATADDWHTTPKQCLEILTMYSSRTDRVSGLLGALPMFTGFTGCFANVYRLYWVPCECLPGLLGALPMFTGFTGCLANDCRSPRFTGATVAGSLECCEAELARPGLQPPPPPPSICRGCAKRLVRVVLEVTRVECKRARTCEMTGASRNTTRSLLKQKHVRMATVAARPATSTRSRSSFRWSSTGISKSLGSSSLLGLKNLKMADGSAGSGVTGAAGCTSVGSMLPGIKSPAASSVVGG